MDPLNCDTDPDPYNFDPDHFPGSFTRIWIHPYLYHLPGSGSGLVAMSSVAEPVLFRPEPAPAPASRPKLVFFSN